MKTFSIKNTIKDVYEYEAFSEFKENLFFMDQQNLEKYYNTTLKDCDNKYHILPSHDNVCSFNFANKHLKDKYGLYKKVYSPKEIENNKSLGTVGLFQFIHDYKAPVAILFAGGGYTAVATMNESMPCAKEIYNMGFSVFVGTYRVKEDAMVPNVIDDVAKCIKYLLNNEKMLNIDMKNYLLCGFSASGHLVGLFSCPAKDIGYKKYNLPRPAVISLAYPVITLAGSTHADSKRFFLGNNNSAENVIKYSIENNVTSEFPPTFLWACEKDNCVPFSNSLLLKDMLEKYAVPYYFTYYEGYEDHGWGRGYKTPSAHWTKKLIDFYFEQVGSD